MPRSTSGVYSLPSGNPVVNGTTIDVAWANPTMADIGAALSDSLSRSGQGSMTAALKLIAGTVGTPALSFALEPGSGMYRAGANDLRFAVAGADAIRFIDDSGEPVGSQRPVQFWNGDAWVPLSGYNPADGAITGGTINGTAIGGGTPAAGTFTTATGTSLVFGTQENKATLNYTTNAARTLTVPSLGGNRTFAFLEQAQTFTALQTLNAAAITLGVSGSLNTTGATLTIANDQISGNAIHGGTISNFASTGITDSATATQLTLSDSALALGMSGSALLKQASDSGIMSVAGGTTVENAARVLFYGSDASGFTTQSVRFFHGASEVLTYRPGANLWRMPSESLVVGGSSYGDASAASLGADGRARFSKGASGVTLNSLADTLAVENSADGGLTIAGPDSATQYLMFGSPTDNAGAYVRWRYSNGRLDVASLKVGGQVRLYGGNQTLNLSLSGAGGAELAAFVRNVTAGGTMTATDFILSSDRRQKENLMLIDNPLERLKKMRGYIGNFIGKDQRMAMVIAQEAQEALAESVTEGDDGYLDVSHPQLIPLLIEAVLALEERI